MYFHQNLAGLRQRFFYFSYFRLVIVRDHNGLHGFTHTFPPTFCPCFQDILLSQRQPINFDYLILRKLRHAAYLAAEGPVDRHLRDPLKLAVVNADLA